MTKEETKLAKRREEIPDEGSPAWMSTFSDLMNLLLCFFVLLFASSTMDAEKLQKIAASFQSQYLEPIAFESSTSGADGILITTGMNQLADLYTYYEEKEKEPSSDREDSDVLTEEDYLSHFEEEGFEQSAQMYEEISQLAESNDISSMVELDYNSQYVIINLSGVVLFDSGSAEIKSNASELMNKLGIILERYNQQLIEIEGHTDNVPIYTAQYKNNRYLSSARSISVYEYLLTNFNFIEANVKYCGYGESRPIASNDTAEGRALNRRVVFKIYNDISSELNKEGE